MLDCFEQFKNVDLSDEKCSVWYLGQEGFVFRTKTACIAVDPYLSDYVDRNCCRFVKWQRAYPAPVRAEQLDFLDAVLVTHTHYDHADPDTLLPIANQNPDTKFIVPLPEVDAIAGLGISRQRIIGATVGQPITIGDFVISPLPAAHEEFHVDADGNYHELSYVIECPSISFFHAGDACVFDGLGQIIEGVDVIMLPINGRDEERNALDIIGNMTAEEAIDLAREANARLLVPMHHDLYAVNGFDTEEFVALLKRQNPDQQYYVFRPGEAIVLG